MQVSFPLSTTQMLLCVWQIYFHHAGKILGLSLLMFWPLFLIKFFQHLVPLSNTVPTDFSSWLVTILWGGGAYLPLLILGLYASEAGACALTVFINDLLNGTKTKFHHSCQTIWNRRSDIFHTTNLWAWRVLPASIPFFIGVGLAAPYLSLDQIGTEAFMWGVKVFWASWFLLTYFVILYMRYFLTTQTVMLEKLQGKSALNRAHDLMAFNPKKGLWYRGEWRLSLLLLPPAIVRVGFYLFSLSFVFMEKIASLWQSNGADSLLVNSSTSNTVSLILGYLGYSASTPLFILTAVLFYRDIRSRSEIVPNEKT